MSVRIKTCSWSYKQHNSPETMGKFYIINAPFLFTTVWSIVKGWLDPVTVSKIVILGKSYKDDLLKQIPAENLPKDFGGKSEEDIFSVSAAFHFVISSNSL